MVIGRRTAIAATAAGLTLVGASVAGGYRLGQSVNVPRGGNAFFTPSTWNCFNRGPSVDCQTGDAFPWVELTGTRSGGVTVRVHTLRDPQGGGLRRVYVKGYPVYVFSAF